MRLFIPLVALLQNNIKLAPSRTIVGPNFKPAPTSKNVIVQMFEWSWDSVASECIDFLGPAGYGYVQVSPAQEHVTGTQWWTDYQPVSYNLTSKRGNREQYQNMITACHGAGVGVIADTIFNHMSGGGSGVGIGGSKYDKYNYPELYLDSKGAFHHCGLEPGDQIVNYGSRKEVQTCELVGLSDLATETEVVRARLAEYANDLISLGVDGLRLDASKHIAAEDLANITSRLDEAVYITQEVIWGYGEPVQPSEYVGIGDVQEFRYTTALNNAFSTSWGIANLQYPDSSWVPGTSANVFVTNHDTERNGAALNYNSPSNTYVLANVFALAHPYGIPTVLSSYVFSNGDDGSPNGGNGTCSGNGGSNGWLCQHRWTPISGMTGFRNQVGSAPITNWVSPSSQQIAFGRGSLGFVAINNLDSPWSAEFITTLPPGSYCDVVNGAFSKGSCTGIAFNISSSGILSARIPSRNAIAVHVGSQGSPSYVSILFEESATTSWGENVYIVGSISQLGSWNPSNAILLSPASYPIWQVVLDLPIGTTFQYKYLRKEDDGSVVWESGPNRDYTASSSGCPVQHDSWR